MGTISYAPPQMEFRHLDEPEIHFTPVKSSTVPRIWDRKPSKSHLGRSKPRKVWKRFRSSFNSMKALQQMIAPVGSGLKESEFVLEINTRRNTDYDRGVKRQCLVGKHSSDDDAENSTRGRSFLETKWESEVSRKRRKLPALTNSTDEHMIVDCLQVEEDEEMAEIGDAPGGTTSTDENAMQNSEGTGESLAGTPDRPDIGAAYPDALPGEPGRLPTEQRGVILNIKPLDIDQTGAPVTATNAADGTATEDVLDTETEKLRSVVATITQADSQEPAMAVPAELTAEQESTLVRSALRSSLDGEDTELLNNFLSKAKAKREAKAAAAAETATAIAPDSEDVEEPQQQVFVEIPTPERRVLEALDANTSSPQKSPSKDERDEKTEANDSGSPVTRRSTRVKRAATTGTLRTTLSLRRATGTEFIFLQRTEAQKLALETKRNTKNNKGDASMPKYKLAGLAKQPPDTSKALDDNIRRPDKPIKYVSWNEDRLVEFEGESSDDELAPDAKPATAKTPEKKRAASSRAAPSPASLKTGAEKAAAAAPAAATTASPRRRVRRLGPPKPLDSTLSLDSTESSSPLSPTTGSPIAKRKKLTPKSPKSLSKIPTPSENGNGERPSLLSGGRSVKTNLLKVNAGSTPMPRRVRRA